MIQKRDKTFETNSSSTHALTFHSRVLQPNELEVDKKGKIIITLKEFGCSGVVKSQADKLAWCILQAQCDADVWLDPWEDDYYGEDDLVDEDDEIVGYDDTDIAWRHDEFIDSDIFKWMEKQICAYTGAKGMKFKAGTKGCIDHQSMYGSVHEFLEEMGVGLLEFIFGDMYLTLDRD
jgi:hypothetical protein